MVIVPEVDWVTCPVKDPGFDVAVYLSMTAPPLLAGAVKVIEALVGESEVAVPIVGAPGTVDDTVQQMIAELRAEGGDVITGLSLLIAFTSNVYEVPGVRELIVTERAEPPETVALFPPGKATTE
jgi:hypothetical protein